MIRFPAALIGQLLDDGERAYPNEACGLIVGRREPEGHFQVTGVERSDNLAAAPARRFEVDTRLHLTLQRLARARGEAVIGLYHSHPDGLARPSATDLAEAWEEGLVWVVFAVAGGRSGPVTAHRLVEAGVRFEEIPLRTAPGPVRSGISGGKT